MSLEKEAKIITGVSLSEHHKIVYVWTTMSRAAPYSLYSGHT